MSNPLSRCIPMNTDRRFVIIANGCSVAWYYEKDSQKTHPELVAEFCTQHDFTPEETGGNPIRKATHLNNGNITVIAGATIHLDSVSKTVRITQASEEYGGDRQTLKRLMPLLVGFDPALATWGISIHGKPISREPQKVFQIEPDEEGE